MRRLLIFGAGLLVLCGIGLAFAPAFVPMDVVKFRIAEKVTAWTGRPVSFSGEPALSMFPYLRFRIEGVAIGNPPELEPGPFITVDRLEGSLKLLPLIFGRIEPSEFRLIRPHLHLTVDEQRRNNWSTPLTRPGKGEAREAKAPGPPPELQTFGQILVTGGSVTYANAATKERMEATAIDASVDWRSADGPLSLDASFLWDGEKVAATGSLGKPLALVSRGTTPARLAITSAPLRLSFVGEANAVSDLQIDGETTLTSPALRRLIEWIGPPMEAGATLGAAAIKGRANWIGNFITFSQAKLELDGNESTGVLTLRVGKGRLGVAGTLAFDRLDLSSYLEGARASVAEGGWQELPVNLPLLRSLDLDLRLSAGQVLIGSTRFGPAAASAVLTSDRIAIDVGEAVVHGGRLRASLEAQMDERSIAGTARANISGVLLKPLLTDVAGIAAVDGTGSGSVEISGRGSSWGALIAGATGNGRVTIADATVGGLDFAAISAGRTLLPPAGKNGMQFRSVAADLSIADGRVSTSNLLAKAPALSIAVEGSASLLQPSITGKGALSAVTETGSRTGADLPFLIGGSWREPTLSLDITLLQRRAGPVPILASGFE